MPLTIEPAPGAPDSPFGGLAPTVTLHDVELCRAGQWNASLGGQVTITQDVIEQLAAAAADPDADHVPVHAGHIDPRFAVLADGEPAMGWVQNVRVVGDRLLGDLADVPAKIAAIIPKAYRRRSVEIAANVRRPNGVVRPLALCGLGLLGVQAPAVKGLADVVARYSAAPGTPGPTGDGASVLVVDPDGVDPADAATGASAQTTSTPTTPDPKERPVASRYTDERLRELLNLAADADVSRMQAELVALPEAPAAAGAPTDPAGTPGAPAAPAPTVPTQGTPSAPTAAADPAGAPAGAGELIHASAGTAPGTVVNTVSPGAAAVSPTDGQVMLSAAQWQGIQSLIADQAATRIDGVLTAALSEGRIAPAEAAGWRAHLSEDEQRTTALLALLPPGRIPTTERGSLGHANLSQHTAIGEAEMDRFEASLALPELRRTPAAVTGASTTTQGA